MEDGEGSKSSESRRTCQRGEGVRPSPTSDNVDSGGMGRRKGKRGQSTRDMRVTLAPECVRVARVRAIV